ncbi:hypothetical protein D1Y85_10060 [Paraburkholderia dinghuensis]|uniref:Uncharacterized protein n=1 Tax=Paraburkholderia dinghuensis TaxID=2305225 RepID=A0A3N6MU23_9BURK|nr:hypothetical protein D1Y85_10060 [Paraburkholderia dinghuensis]
MPGIGLLTRLRTLAATPVPQPCDQAACARCRHRDNERGTLERRIPGLVVFSSGYGASAAESRLCRLHDRLTAPGDSCAEFSPRD